MAAFETALLWALGGIVIALVVITTITDRKSKKTVRQIARERENLRDEQSKYDNRQRPLT